MQTLNPYIGWVPFPYFQHVLIVLLLLSYSNYKKVNETLDKNVYDKIKNKRLKDFIEILIPLLPIIIIFYLDITYSSFSMISLGVTNYISNKTLNSFLKVMGGYCLIQVAAQDIGIKTGTIQSEFTKQPILQFLMYVGVAYALTQDRSMALIACLLYFQMKFFISRGITKDVCFD
jgi:hypothetical protein